METQLNQEKAAAVAARVSKPTSRMRSYIHFILAVIIYFVAQALASRYTLLWGSAPVRELASEFFFLLLLLAAFAWLGRLLSPEAGTLARLGWPLRSGWGAEAGLGVACGWTMAVAAVLVVALSGGIAIELHLHWNSLGWLLTDALYFALLAAVEEMGFRGYGFQRLSAAIGPAGAAIGFAAIYAIVQALVPGAPRISVWTALLLSLVLSTAYVRTQALWVSWGINFGWKASRAVLFGLAVAGDSEHTHLVQGSAMGRYWLTGGGFGIEASWLAFLILLVAWPLVVKLTAELDDRYNPVEIVAGGVPVELQVACKPSAPPLVQIAPAPRAPVVPEDSPIPASAPVDQSQSGSMG